MKPSRRKLLSPPPSSEDRRVVALLRGSTVKQQLTLGAQEETARRYCRYKGFDLLNVFTDSGTSGATQFLTRDEVRKMLRFMADQSVRQIICTRLDRAFRSTGDAIMTLDTLHRAGVLIHFCEQEIDPTTASGKMMFQILAVFAEFEKNIRAERQIEAGEQQRALGHKSGVNVPYGWQAVPDEGRITKEGRPASRLEPIAGQQEVLREILRRAEEGESDEYIARVLNEAGFPTAKAGQTMKYRGKEITCSGEWHAQTVFSVRSFARLHEGS